MRRLIKVLCLLLALVAFTSCNMEMLRPGKEVKFAEDYLSKLREKDFDYIKSLISQEILPKANDELLSQMARAFREGELLSTELIGSHVLVMNDNWQGNFTFEYHFTSGWNVANVAFKKVDGKYSVIGLNVYQTTASQREINAFTLSSKTLRHYFVLLMAVSIPLFIIVTIYSCLRTPMPKRKWLWIIFIILGINAFQLNWTTGQSAIKPFSVYLLGASAFKGGTHAPWIISFSIPLGAILFWFRRKRFIALSEEANKNTEEDAP